MITIIILVFILIGLMYSPQLYTKYIHFRQTKVDLIRQDIYKHFREEYVYLPSRNLMTYNLNYPVSMEYWVNYISNEKRKFTNKH